MNKLNNNESYNNNTNNNNNQYEEYSNDNEPPPPLCPGHSLPCILRTAATATNAGRKFYVCCKPQRDTTNNAAMNDYDDFDDNDTTNGND